MLVYLVVLIEAILFGAAVVMAIKPGRSSWLSRFLRGTFAGMTFCALVHGFCFGVLQVEGPHGRDDPLLLVGFGLVAAFFPGLLLGMIVGLVLGRKRPKTAEAAREV